MPKIKITVVKRFSPKEVFGKEIKTRSGNPVTICSFKDGQEFVVDNINNMPEGFCGWAWRDLYKDIAVLYFNGDFPSQTEPGTIYTSCTDGRKPVVFKLEQLEA